MDRVSTVTGLLLCGLTLVGLMGVSSGKIASALFPMIAGIPLVICGIIAYHAEGRRRALYAAAVVALLGAILTGGRTGVVIVDLLQGEKVNRFALLLVGTMAAICIAYILLWVRAFFRERRRQSHAGS